MKKTMLSIGLVLGIALIGVGVALLVTHEGEEENREESPITNEENPLETTGNTTPSAFINEAISINISGSNPPVSYPVSGNQTTESHFIRDTEAP